MSHVFVLPGDVTRLAAGSWLLPTDRTLHVTAGWGDRLRTAVAALGPEADDFRSERVKALVLPGWPQDEPQPVLVPVPFGGIADAGQVVEPLTAALTAAAVVVRSRSSRTPPLVALPAFGSAGGGGDRQRGALLSRILDVAGAVARERQVDIALVLRDGADLALANAVRREDPRTWSELGGLVGAARDLAARASSGQLVPFIGAGVSISAGLPTWKDLLGRLLDEGDLPVDERAGFWDLGPLDQAHVLRRRFDQLLRPFAPAVAALTDAPRYGLAPALLAGLPTKEAVTLNYDTLYEKASADAGRPAVVLPKDAVVHGERWLLKLHGTVDDPDSIVLTREDYLGYRRGREALSALAKALLLTRHLLFVGFGLSDDHFHELVHEVRKVYPGKDRFGTALLLATDPLQERLWSDDLDLVAMGGADVPDQARRLEIFLDCMLAHADRGLPYFLDDRYGERLTGPEQRLKERLLALAAAADPEERTTPAWQEVERMLESLGGQARTSS